MLTAFDFFQACQFLGGTLCARRIHMKHVAAPYLSELEYSFGGLATGASSLRADLEGTPTITTPDEARMTLALEEMENALQLLSGDTRLRSEIEGFFPTQVTLTMYAENARSFYRSYGIDIPEAKVALVDELPKPYDRKGFSALTADDGDRKRHGIEPGIYILPQAVVPVLVEYLIAHELIHVWLGAKSPDDSCTELEEGLAEYLSVFGYLANQYGRESSGSFCRYYRLNSSCGSRYETYVDGLRQIVGLIGVVGSSELFTRAKLGRAELNELLRSSINTEIDHGQHFIPLPTARNAANAAEYEDAFYNTLIFPRSLVVSAEAYLIARRARDGMTIREVSSACSMSEELTRHALGELDERALITLRLDGQVISRNLSSTHIAMRHLRYDFR